MKLIKKCTIILVSLTLALLSATVCTAETLYYENGYYYSYIDNDSVKLAGHSDQIQTIVVPAVMNNRSVVSVANYAFKNDTIITEVDFSKASNLTEIGLCSFANCTSLNKKLSIPASIEFIDNCAFENCSSIPEVEITADLLQIPNQCFKNCTSLRRAKLNDGLEEILNYAFANCNSLEYVLIPASVTYIAPSAFNNDPNLKIYGFADSYAQTYALEHDIPFVEMVRFMLGDVDGIDGVNISDATAVQSYLAELRTLEGIYLLAADANQDDIVDISDATAIQMKLAEYELPYPSGQYVTQEIVSE